MKIIYLVFGVWLTCGLFSCSKKPAKESGVGAATVSRRILNITINGHTYHDTSLGSSMSFIGGPGNYGLNLNDTASVNVYGATFSYSTSHLFGSFEGTKSDRSSFNGTYKIGRYFSSSYNDTVTYGFVNITDVADGHKVYHCLADTTTSYFTLTNVSATGFEGVFSFMLISDTTVYPVTGDFKFTN